MSNNPRISENLGFLTVIDQPRLGLIGGYLVLNPAGRPLEFHCTTPVRPNRAQEILYGNTLEPFLYGEQIAKTLIARSKIPVDFILTNAAPVLVVQELVEPPVLYVFETKKPKPPSPESVDDASTVSEEEPATTIEISRELNESLKEFGIENSRLQTASTENEESLRIPDVPGLDTARWKNARIGNRRIALRCGDDEVWNKAVEEIKRISLTIDLAEPFTRIRLAIDEAQRAA